MTHFIRPTENSQFLIVENRTSHFEEPDRGLVGKNALYDSNALVLPDLTRQMQKQKELYLEVKEVRVKHLDEMTRFRYKDDIFDVVGWKGDLYPFSLHMDHIMPLMSHRAHLPPSAHTTFVAKDFVICSFLPRPLETDNDALKVPFYHQNIDYDEVLFYHEGDFFSRDNLHAGMMSFHPAGFAHGPHPKAMKGIGNKTETNEYAVMIDSRWPLHREVILDQVE
ncbi:MAG: homogentisate 1,2-dioxygenase, partial [Bdellovibrionales bacterium]|nr:homogentisate 1,2-dioxygenase [Bdellovibrionales bacterium]